MAMQALVMGFGGTGAHILTALKELTVLKHGSKPESIKFLLFDTIADWRPGKTVQILGGAAEEKLAAGSEEKTSLDPATEYFYLRDHDPDLKTHVYNFLAPTGTPERYPHLKDWLHAPWLKIHVKEASLSIVEGAAQQRQIGRFAIFQNADRVKAKITQLVSELAQHAGNASVNVWLIGSSAGGTGAGCLLDAAYLTRLAVGTRDITLTGVIVLPDVYNDKGGISRARAYSLFRELNRIQGLGIEKTGAETAMEFSSRVFYDSRQLVVSSVKKGLFDDLFYLGRDCNNDEQRKDFFASVANSIDPYLDENSGPVLLQESVNTTAPASSMGGARLYVPEETFADIFAWEQVESYLKGLTAPNEEQDGIFDLYAGVSSDREDDAEKRVMNLLALFGDLLQRAKKPDERLDRLYIQNTVTPEKIVAEWYQFGGGSIAGINLSPTEKQAVQLAYLNPYLSLIDADESKVALADRETKTYKENEKAKGLKESQDQSRDRFADRLDEITKKYVSPTGGERSFFKGRKQVLDVISAQMKARVDSIFLNELTQTTQFGADAANPRQGTVLTRLRAEGQHSIAALKKIDGVVAKFIATVNEEDAFRNQQPVSALNQLRSSKSPGFLSMFSAWVESYQQSARDECYEYIRWYQKRELLKDMQQLVRNVIKRFEDWQSVLDGAFNSLVLQPPESSLYLVRERFLKKELYSRLYRLGQNRSARIGAEQFDQRNPDLTMQGYRDELKKSVQRGEQTLADEALAASRWEAGINKDGMPELKLVLNLRSTFAYGTDLLSDIHQNLHDYFRNKMKGYFEDKDVFDYLLYIQRNKRVGPEEIASILSDAAEVLINATGGDEECRLIYKDPKVPEKQNLATAIRMALSKFPGLDVKDSETTHSDKNSITMLKIKKPNLDAINDLNKCYVEYADFQTMDPKGDNKYDAEVYRSQVYHAFRAELEAWFIERRYCKRNGVRADGHHIPPRIVRLLDDPAMMQAFVHCLATGAVERVKGVGWVWHDTVNGRDLTLVDWEDNPSADVVQSAVVFVLQQREGRKGGLIQINLEDARQSAVDRAKKNKKTRDAMLAEFSKKLDKFLKENLLVTQTAQVDKVVSDRQKQERQGLEMVLEFYSDPETRTALQHRMDLP
jgi:hypothetical protein